MKKILFPLTAFLLLTAFFSFKRENTEALFKVDKNTSGVTWEAHKALGGGHNGTINISEGQVTVNEGKITAGTFSMDMNTLHSLDLEGAMRDKLEHHLKSPDFFDVSRFPMATFTIKEVKPLGKDSAMVTGALKIKDVTKDISFPFTYQVMGKRMELTAKNIKVNRIAYGVTYGSKSLIKTLGNKAIDDEFIIGFSLSMKLQD